MCSRSRPYVSDSLPTPSVRRPRRCSVFLHVSFHIPPSPSPRSPLSVHDERRPTAGTARSLVPCNSASLPPAARCACRCQSVLSVVRRRSVGGGGRLGARPPRSVGRSRPRTHADVEPSSGPELISPIPMPNTGIGLSLIIST